MKHNYTTYLRKQQAPSSSPSMDKTKIISVSVVTILLLVGLFFLVRGTIGLAILAQEKNVTSPDCAPPQIVSPEGSCCDDLDENKICDVPEEQDA